MSQPEVAERKWATVEVLQEHDLAELIQKKNLRALKEELQGMSAGEIAELADDLEDNKAIFILRLLPQEKASDVFSELEPDHRDRLLQQLTDERLAELFNSMAPDDRTRVLEDLPGTVTQRLINLLSPDERRIALQLLGYPENSVGRLMTPEYIMVRPEWTVERALRQVREYYVKAETANVLYVVDGRGKLIGDLLLAELVIAEPEAVVEALMGERPVVALPVDMDQEEAVEVFRKHVRVALPVVDKEGVLLGIVTLDDVLDVAEEEATEDFQKAGGVEALEEPYLAVPFWTLIRKRAPWLVVLFLSEMLTTTAMARFEEEIQRAVILAIFVPLIISSGGNSGSQASTLIIRALAIRDVSLSDWWRIMRREVLAGLTLGVILGSIGALRIAVFSLAGANYGPHWPWISATIFVALIGVVLWGTFAGSMLPLLLKRVGLDPATSSAPFVATLVDVTGIVIYFEVAAFVLRGKLL
ncbi:MAG: magnesium transporter MgtE [Fimbriimonadales bacterium]|nr:MAG: magnesium transporter MgtE [Fimbriimonadales bacterium]